MHIISATPLHTPLIAPLFDAYRQFYNMPSDLAGAQHYIHARLTNQESRIFLALDDNETPLGFVQLYPTFESLNMRTRWVLYDLFTTPSARKLGVGRALMERAKELAIETGAVYLELDTARDNHCAQALYESLGYERDNQFYHYALDVDSILK
jgi:ribosomal protein S18 acetylase RimI-like enzyme